MYKIELKLDGHFINNFYNGSIYDLVFLDLEFWPHFVNGKAVQRIYGYTITRIFKASKQQYIKTKFLEYEQEETEIVKDILKEIQIFKHKVFIGFNIQRSDLKTLWNRSKAMNIYSEVNQLIFFDLETCRIPGRKKDLSGLFKYLEIKILQRIDGSYFRYNPNKVLNKESGYQDILVTMFDYCLRDAAGYFEIVSKWNKKFPLVIKEALSIENIPTTSKSNKIEVCMENPQVDPTQPISVLTVADLEALLTKVVQKVIRQELTTLKQRQVKPEESSAAHPLENFIDKFGAWEDERTTEEIIKDIYESRIVSSSEYSL